MGEEMGEISKPARRASKALTATLVRSVKEPGKYHDGGGLGLYLRVEPNGSRFWIQRIMIRGKRRELGLGSPPLISLAEARDAAADNKRLARDGGDPLQAKRDARAIPTFAEAARRVHEIHKPSWRNEKHANDFINSLEAYAVPHIGGLRVSDVSSADLLRVLTPIWMAKPETARRVRQRISTVMKWAIAQGWRSHDPARDIAQALPKHDRTKKHRKALPYDQVATCIETVKASGAWYATKLALEFLILTATRSGEVRGARWEEIDLHGAKEIAAANRATWVIPAERMKMKKPHRIPLSARAVEILKEADLLRDASGLIFPSKTGRQLSDMTLSKLVKQLGFNADVHGFRTSFRTWVQEQTDYPREVAEAALAHAGGDAVERAYARSDVFEKRREMMEGWAAYLYATEPRPRAERNE
ncbi:MAG: integrase arm-type DNA-binding domain-containing protein [Boseongicola sp.]|nr:integrase arm-type DNA-binding domain-containing protein [Boseongicola sp.]